MPDIIQPLALELPRPLEKFDRGLIVRNFQKINDYFKKENVVTYSGNTSFMNQNTQDATVYDGGFLKVFNNTNMAFIYLSFHFKVNFSVPASGDLVNQFTGTLKSQFLPAFEAPLASMGQGRGLLGAIWGDGRVGVTSAVGTADIQKDVGHQLAGWYYLK